MSRGRLDGTSGRLHSDVRGLRVGLAKEFFENLPAEIASALERALDFYKRAGAELVDRTMAVSSVGGADEPRTRLPKRFSPSYRA